MQLRPYQINALEAVQGKLWAGVNRQLVKWPTGTGKTVLFANLPSFLKLQNRMLVLVHREELAQQAADKLRKWNPSLSVGIEMADSRCSTNDQLVVGSVQTLGKESNPRLAQLKPEEFGAIVVDECHHSTGSTYKNILNHFNVYEDTHRLCLGLTATPNRADGKGLGDIYQEIVYDMSLLDGIKQGWLADLRGIRVTTNNSLDNVGTLGGDLNLGQLTNAINTEARNDLIVRAWLEYGMDRQTVAFTTDIQHTQDLAMAFKRYGVVAEGVWGTDPARSDKLQGHRDGRIRVLTNCQILTEGYDDWRIGCIVLARPTKSETLYTQIVGRGTRIPDGISNLGWARENNVPIAKEDCILLDVVDMTSRHSLVSLPSLFGANKDLDMKGKKITYVMQEIEDVAKARPGVDTSNVKDIDKLRSFAEQVDLFRIQFSPEIVQYSEFQWFKTGVNQYILNLGGNDIVRITQDLLDNWKVWGQAFSQQINEVTKTFPDAIRVADSLVRSWAPRSFLTIIKRDAKWHKDPPTPAQIAVLKRFKVNIPAGISKGDAQKRIAQLLAARKDERLGRMAKVA